MIGRTVAHYRIIEKLGAGGMGDVFLAEDTKLDRQVALKFLPASMWNDDDAKQRLIREAKAASKLDHPNIVTIHGIEESEGRLFIVMAHVKGTTLDKYLATNVRDTDGLINLTVQITDGLQRAHDAGVIHRDLKPANILVDDRGWVRLLDFGIARIRGTTRLTQAGSTVGTLAYSPPELIHGSEAEPASDIYSLGVVLYQMLTGHLPFEADHEGALLYSILQDEPKPMSDHDSAIPANLQAVVMRCLEKRPENRHASCTALANELKSCRSVQISDAKGPSASERPSIAVLPFLNRSASVEDEYFSDGLADELLNMLGKIRGLRVAAQASSFQFKGRNEDLAVIGQKLNVVTLLGGSVRKSGNRVRITVQLMRAADSDQLWSETYDRTMDDIFAVQDDIAQSVVKELRSTLLGEEQDSNKSRALKAEVAQAARGRGTDPEAHRLYLLGRHLINRYTREDSAKGIEYFKQALELDPEFALAWVLLSLAYNREADSGWIPTDVGYSRARESVERALALEPDLADAHAGMGYIKLVFDWDWKGAEEYIQRALKLAPNDAGVLRAAGRLDQGMGHIETALDRYRSSLDRDPLNSAGYFILGIALYCVGRLVEADEAYRKALEIAPQAVSVHAFLSLVLLDLGRGEEALSAAGREPDEAFRLWATSIIRHALGHSVEADVALQELTAKYAGDSAFQIAEVYAARGAADTAFEWLERAYAQRDGGLASWLKTSPHLRALHADPRWPAFLKKMGLAD